MDRNTLTGLVLIGLLLTVFTIINKPTEEEIKQQEAEIVKVKEAQLKQQEKDSLLVSNADSSGDNLDVEEKENAVTDPKQVVDSIFTRVSDQFTVDFSTRGGQISSLYLNDYKSYESYSTESKEALCLFKNGDQLTSYSFFDGDQLIQTKDLSFELKNESKTEAIEVLKKGVKLNTKNAELSYRLSAYLFQNGNENQALTIFEEALSIDYDLHKEFFQYFPSIKNNKNLLHLLIEYKK